MSYLKQVQRGIDFIEANLDFDFTLEQVAQAACISQWHFQRIFKALTHETLKTYIRSRRLALALDKLLKTDERILDIALQAGFSSQESFTRAFKKTFDLTPHEYRSLANKNLFLKKARFDQNYLNHLDRNLSLEPEIIHQPARQLVGLRTCFYSVDSEKNNIAEKLPPLWASILQRLNEIPNLVPGPGYGVLQPTAENTDLLEYYAAFEVTSIGELPEGMEHIKIPATTYARFSHRGYTKTLDKTVDYVYSNWLLRSGMKHTYGPDIEIYGERYQPNSDDSVIYYNIPIEANTDIAPARHSSD